MTNTFESIMENHKDMHYRTNTYNPKYIIHRFDTFWCISKIMELEKEFEQAGLSTTVDIYGACSYVLSVFIPVQ